MPSQFGIIICVLGIDDYIVGINREIITRCHYIPTWKKISIEYL